MRRSKCTAPAVAILSGALLASLAGPARGQMFGMKRSLGGYGEAGLPMAYGQQRGPLIPYAGGQGGFIPYGDLEAPLAGAAMAAPRPIAATPIGGAGSRGTPIGGVSRMMGPRIYAPRGGMGLTGPARGAGPVGRGAMSPGLGYPFRRPMGGM